MFKLLKFAPFLGISYVSIFFTIHELAHVAFNSFKFERACFLNCPNNAIAGVIAELPVSELALNEHLCNFVADCFCIFFVVSFCWYLAYHKKV